ncbi:hypothetical protein Tsp_11117, partial [Trichinella spiralis]|uniref:hypothetical protein n=1 Tax=Trichinella spiralis TaxID=6334 RepID=UPI0001EFBD88
IEPRSTPSYPSYALCARRPLIVYFMAEKSHLVLNERGCRGSIYTNLDVDAVLDCNPHADDCTPDSDILYKMEKKNALKRRAAEEMKTIPQIYREEASSASADLETASQFPTYKSTSANSPVAGDSTPLANVEV